MNLLTRRVMIVAVAMAALGGGVAMGEATLASLKQSFARRLPRLQQAKQAGKIGETAAGYVEAVQGEGDAASLIREENADRAALYQLIAKSENATAESVAERAARRNFDRAGRGEWLKGRDGKWRRK